MATLQVGPTRLYTTIQAALNVANTNPATVGAMDVIEVDAGTYTESLSALSPSGGWLIPCIIRAADPANKPVIASTGAAQAVLCNSIYRGSAAGQLTLQDLVFSGWSAASNAVIYILTEGLVVYRCDFVGCTGRKVIANLGGTASREARVDSCTFTTSGSVGSGSQGIILGYTNYAVIKNNKAVCPTNVQFQNGDALRVEHNSVLGTWNTGGSCKAFAGIAAYRGNVVQNLGTGGAAAIDATGGSYTENVYFGTWTTPVSGTNGGGNQNADPLFTNTGTGDLTLQLTSPAIRSLARSANTLLDIEGDSRSDPTDAGAYEMVLDVTPPTITGWTRTSKSTIVLTFSEDLDETSAETAANYTTSPSRTVSATLTDTNEVTLTLSPAVDTVILTVDDVEDLVGNAMAAAWTRELAWAESEGTAEIAYAVSGTGGPVDFLPAWDPMPSGVGSEMTLERLVFASLMSDARIGDDEIPTDGTGDRRGWWGDAYSARPDNTGSRLWHLMSRAGVKAREYEDAIRSALAWMVTDRLCSSVEVTVSISGNIVSAVVSMTLDSGEVKTIPYPDLWSSYAG